MDNIYKFIIIPYNSFSLKSSSQMSRAFLKHYNIRYLRHQRRYFESSSSYTNNSYEIPDRLNINTVNNLINTNIGDNLILKSIENFYLKMGPTIFLHNLTIALFKSENIIQSNHVIYNLFINKIKDIYLKSNIPNFNNEGNENICKEFNIIEDHKTISINELFNFIFDLSLHLNKPIISYQILIDRIENHDGSELNEKLFNSENISKLIDCLTVTNLQKTNIENIKCIFKITRIYNDFVINLNRSDLIFEFSDYQIKSIIDKAYSCLFNSTFTQTNNLSESRSSFIPPFPTIELVIREFGEIISQKVSNSISYYKPENINNDFEEEEDFNLSKILNRQLLSKYLQFCYNIIQDRCSNNDPVTVYKIWSIIKPFHNKLYNSTISSETNNMSNNFYYYQTISKMITLFSKNRRYRKLITQLLFDVPLDAIKICPELMSSILNHCARTKNSSLGSIVSARYDGNGNDNNDSNKAFGNGGDLSILGTGDKFTPGQIHSLLAYNLRLGNKERSFGIIKYIESKLMGFTAVDFNEIIRSILYSKCLNAENQKLANYDLAWEMILNNDQSNAKNINKFAIITYLDYMINNIKNQQDKTLDFDKVNKIYEMSIANVPLNDRKYWNHFYMSYFKYLNRKYPLKVCKLIYENSLQYSGRKMRTFKNSRKLQSPCYFQKLADFDFSSNPFTTRYNHVRILLDYNLRILILKDIYQKSDSYLKIAQNVSSEDLEEAKSQHILISNWVYKEIISIYNDSSKENKAMINNSILIDLIKTIDRRSRKIGFEAKGKKATKLSELERKFKLDNGEKVAIGDILLSDEYLQSIEKLEEEWKHSLRSKFTNL